MANRYWVGVNILNRNGTWDTTTTSVWSTSSGGTGGASVPTAADSVFFDQASTYTVTQTGALTCLDITVSAGTVTFATGTSPTLAVSGIMSLVAGTVWSSTGTITFNTTLANRAVTTNGVTLAGNLNFSGTGSWILGSALTTSGSIQIAQGVFSTQNFALSATQLLSPASLTRTIYLGSSTITLTGTTPVSLGASGLTFNAGTSQINCTTTSGMTFTGAGLTYYNVSFTATSLNSRTITGANTFNNLSFTAPIVTYIVTQTLSANQTINGTFSVVGTTAVIRMLFVSNTLGTARTLTCAAVSIPDCDFRDITLAGAAAGSSPTRAGNCGGNTGITFPAAKTVYWNLAGAQNWSATGWATSSGGTPAVNNFPLAQDTAVFDNTGAVTGIITMNNAWRIGTVDMSARTSAMTLATGSTSINIYGDLKNGTGVTYTGTATFIFSGRGNSQSINSGAGLTNPITIANIGGSVTLSNPFLLSGSSGLLYLQAGTLNLAESTSCNAFDSQTTTYNRTLAFGSNSTLTLTGSTWAAVPSLLTITGTGIISMTSSSAKSFGGGNVNYSTVTLNQGGVGALTISGSNTFANITNTVQPTTVTFTAATVTSVSNFGLTGTAGNLVTINSTGTFTLNLLNAFAQTISCDYLSITNSTATSLSPAYWYAGANSVNVSGNSGWIFTAPPSTGNPGSFFLLF